MSVAGCAVSGLGASALQDCGLGRLHWPVGCGGQGAPRRIGRIRQKQELAREVGAAKLSCASGQRQRREQRCRRHADSRSVCPLV